MTEVFGPVGIGWGHRLLKSETIVCRDTVFREATVAVWVRVDGVKSEEWTAVGSDTYAAVNSKGVVYYSDEAGKIAYTDALTKALSDIGLSADVFSEHWDSKYARQEAPAPQYSQHQGQQNRLPTQAPQRRQQAPPPPQQYRQPPPPQQYQQQPQGPPQGPPQQYQQQRPQQGGRGRGRTSPLEQQYRDAYYAVKPMWADAGRPIGEYISRVRQAIGVSVLDDNFKLASRGLDEGQLEAGIQAINAVHAELMQQQQQPQQQQNDIPF
jgi:hypothetical protein